MGKIWIIADSHWNHENIIKYESRPVDYNEQIIANWREQVSDDDTVIHLGDVIFKRASELVDIMKQLPGHKILTVGNHDRHSNAWFMRAGFGMVCKMLVHDNILFSHEPIDLNTPEYKNIKYNIHGHFHRSDSSRYQYPFYSDKHICLSIEEMDYKMIEINDFLKLKTNGNKTIQSTTN